MAPEQQRDNADVEDAVSALLSVARREGAELDGICAFGSFNNGERSIHVQMSGRAVRYSMVGRVAALPDEFKASASAFYGMWCEAGVLPDIERAFVFIKAWMLDGVEVDQLPVPERERTKYGISGV